MAQRATSLGPKPSFYFFFYFLFCFFCFPFFVLNRKKKPVFAPKKGNFCLFICVSLCFSLAFLGLPLFFPFSFFVSLLFFSFFLPSCFSFLFLVLAFSFCFVCFLVQDVILFLFFCLLSCFVLNHHVWFLFALHLVFLLLFFVFVALVFCNFFDFWLPIKNISQKFGNCKKPKNEKCRKKDTGTRAVSTGVLTNSVFFFFCVSLNFAFLLKTL